MNSLKKFVPLILVIVYFLLHLPFLTADPDRNVDPLVRHAWTDEGLYSSQIRNFVDHGTFNLKENSTLVRGPLFNIIQMPFFYVFGTNRITGRMIVLMMTLLVLFVFSRMEKLRVFSLFMMVFALIEYHIFQFVHYSMAELICIDFIMFALYFVMLSRKEERKKKRILLVFLSALFLCFCYCTKIQFLYVGGIVPAVYFLLSVHDVVSSRKLNFNVFSDFIWAFLFSGILVALYYLVWFLPNRDFYLYVMSSETYARFGSGFKMFWADAKFNYKYIIWTKDFGFMAAYFYFFLLVGLALFIFRRKKSENAVLTVFSLVWIIFELHKLPMKYLPNQYLISLFFAAGIFIASLCSEIVTVIRKLRIVFIVLALAALAYNFYGYSNAYRNRTYQLTEINNYLSKFDLKEKTIIGPWAASVTWKAKAKTLPVWDKYFNWKNPISVYKPAIVVTEEDERDSDYTYKNQGIDLNSISDSSKSFNVWNYKLVLYWIKQ